MEIEKRLAEAGITLPTAPKPVVICSCKKRKSALYFRTAVLSRK